MENSKNKLFSAGTAPRAFADIAGYAVECGRVEGRTVDTLQSRLGEVRAEEVITALFAMDRSCKDESDGAWKGFFSASLTTVMKDAISGNDPDSSHLLDLLKKEIERENSPRKDVLDILMNLRESALEINPEFRKILHETFLEVHSHYRVLQSNDVERIDRVIRWTQNKDIDRIDADFLFSLNDVLDKQAHCDAWQRLFVESIASHVLIDSVSPGQVDFTEAEWLIRRIEGNGSLDMNEKALLDYLGQVNPRGQNLGDLVASISEFMKAQEDSYLNTIRSLVRALEAKDRYTAQHSSRVAYYSKKLGERLGLSDKMLRRLRFGAIMHDLGKIGVPDEILNKPASLTKEEFDRIRRHPIDTVKIMQPLEHLKEFMDIAMLHHERWDGGGYPDGLKGTTIPLLSRIVAIADTWDAMVGDRVYRKALPQNKALAILEKERDLGQWDPELLDAFIEMIREKNAEGETDHSDDE